MTFPHLPFSSKLAILHDNVRQSQLLVLIVAISSAIAIEKETTLIYYRQAHRNQGGLGAGVPLY